MLAGLEVKGWGMSGRKGWEEKSLDGQSINYFSMAAIRHHDQANLQKEGLIVASWFQKDHSTFISQSQETGRGGRCATLWRY